MKLYNKAYKLTEYLGDLVLWPRTEFSAFTSKQLDMPAQLLDYSQATTRSL